MTGADAEYCADCAYIGKSYGMYVCDYMLRTRQRRSKICRYGVGCTEHSKLHPEREIDFDPSIPVDLSVDSEPGRKL